MDDAGLPRREVDDAAGLTRLRDRGGGRSCRLQERVAVEAIGVRVPERGSAADANAGAAVETGGELLDLPVVEARGDGGLLLDEDLRELPSARQRVVEDLLDEGAIEHEGGILAA